MTNDKATLRKQFSHLRQSPGPGSGWQARAARELGYTPSYISRLQRGLVSSPAAQAALAAWKAKHKVAA